MQNLDFEHLKSIFLLAVFAVLGALFISTGEFLLIFLGILCIITLVFIETYFLQKITFQVKKLDKELKNSIEQAQMTIKAMKIILEQLERLMSKSQMENVMFNINLTIKDHHSKILSEMKDLQSLIYKDVERHCQQKFGQLAKKVQELEVKISK